MPVKGKTQAKRVWSTLGGFNQVFLPAHVCPGKGLATTDTEGTTNTGEISILSFNLMVNTDVEMS